MFPSPGSLRSKGSKESLGDKGPEGTDSVDSAKGHLAQVQERGPNFPGAFVVSRAHTGRREGNWHLPSVCCMLCAVYLGYSI